MSDHLDQLRSTLEQAEGLSPEVKGRLLSLVETVRSESGDQADAQSEDVSEKKGMTGLIESVEQLEASHPEIAALINQVAMTLSRMGI